MLDEWPLAEEAFNRAVQADPAYAEAWAFLGEARQQNGGDGRPALQHAADLSPDSLIVQALQALSWRRQGRLDLALVNLHAIADRDVQNAIWQAELGNTLAQMGDLPTALAYFQKAVEVEPQNPVYWRMLASFCLHYDISLADTGLDAARQAVALAPEDPQSLDVLAQVMVALNDLVSARRLLERALSARPDDPQANLHLGLVLLAQGEREAAFQALMTAVRAGGDQPAAVQAKQALAENFPEAP
jgi:tetratricopeptide (TPR) repeat protein